jgi:hypothetical protein
MPLQAYNRTGSAGTNAAASSQQDWFCGTNAAASSQQESRKADAKARTAAQAQALDALGDWLARLRGIVHPALCDRPDLLDKLGL